MDRGSKTSRRAGKPAANDGQQPLPGAPPKAETAGQRVNRLTKTYTDRVPLTSWQGARECVKRAVDAGVDDAAIAQALGDLADHGTSLTLASLRRAIYGPGQGPPGGGNGYKPWKNPADQSVYDEEIRPA